MYYRSISILAAFLAISWGPPAYAGGGCGPMGAGILCQSAGHGSPTFSPSGLPPLGLDISTVNPLGFPPDPKSPAFRGSSNFCPPGVYCRGLGKGALLPHAQLVRKAARYYEDVVIPAVEYAMQDQANFGQKRKVLWGYRQYMYQIADALEEYNDVGHTPGILSIYLRETHPEYGGQYSPADRSLFVGMDPSLVDPFLEEPSRFPQYMEGLIHEVGHALFYNRSVGPFDPKVANSEWMLTEVISSGLGRVYKGMVEQEEKGGPDYPFDPAYSHGNLIEATDVESYLFDMAGRLPSETYSFGKGMSIMYPTPALPRMDPFLSHEEKLRALSLWGTMGAQHYLFPQVPLP